MQLKTHSHTRSSSLLFSSSSSTSSSPSSCIIAEGKLCQSCPPRPPVGSQSPCIRYSCSPSPLIAHLQRSELWYYLLFRLLIFRRGLGGLLRSCFGHVWCALIGINTVAYTSSLGTRKDTCPGSPRPFRARLGRGSLSGSCVRRAV